MDNNPEEQVSAWSAPILRLHDYWRRIHPAGGSFPGRQHFDPLDIADLMALVWMVDVVRAGSSVRFRYRLLGTRHVRAMERDYTGQWIDEAHPGFLTSPYYGQFLDTADGRVSWRRGQPGFHVHKDYYEMERLMLPMARDGAVVDMILSMTVYFDRAGKVVS